MPVSIAQTISTSEITMTSLVLETASLVSYAIEPCLPTPSSIETAAELTTLTEVI